MGEVAGGGIKASARIVCRSLRKMSCTLLVSAVHPTTSCRLNQKLTHGAATRTSPHGCRPSARAARRDPMSDNGSSRTAMHSIGRRIPGPDTVQLNRKHRSPAAGSGQAASPIPGSLGPASAVGRRLIGAGMATEYRRADRRPLIAFESSHRQSNQCAVRHRGERAATVRSPVEGPIHGLIKSKGP